MPFESTSLMVGFTGTPSTAAPTCQQNPQKQKRFFDIFISGSISFKNSCSKLFGQTTHVPTCRAKLLSYPCCACPDGAAGAQQPAASCQRLEMFRSSHVDYCSIHLCEKVFTYWHCSLGQCHASTHKKGEPCLPVGRQPYRLLHQLDPTRAEQSHALPLGQPQIGFLADHCRHCPAFLCLGVQIYI